MRKPSSKNQELSLGFTLLELAIVIAVIGLLSSIFLVSFPAVQKRARIAQGWRFSDSLRGALQADMVAWWPFDETSGTTAKDRWFNQYQGTVNGAEWVEGIVNRALRFDGSDFVATPLNPQTTASKLRDAFTIEMWIKPDNCDTDYADQILYSAESTLNAFIVFYYFGQTSGDCGRLRPYYSINGVWRSCGGNKPPLGEWTHITITFDKNTGYFKDYRNGKLLQSCSYGAGANIGNPNSNIRIGQGWQGTFKGTIDEVRIYSTAFPQATIQQHYAEGLKRHQNLVKK